MIILPELPNIVFMIKLNHSQIQKLKSLNVTLVYLFGSYAENKSSSLSDVDIGIVFPENNGIKRTLSEIYNELYFIFSDIFKGKSIDIVFLQNATLELRFDVVKHGENIYCKSKNEKFEFEDNVTMLYMDFKPILNEFNQAILSRI